MVHGTLAVRLAALAVLVQTVGGNSNNFLGDTFWEFSREKQVWDPVTTESMQYRLSKVDQELILTSRMNSTDATCSSIWPYRDAMGYPSNNSLTDYGLSVLWSKSVFCVSSNGAVFERFWNEHIWVYVNHQSPLFTAASLTAYAGRLYVSTEDGNVYERRRVGQELKWISANVPSPHRVASPPRIDPEGSLWFVSDSGHLLQCERKVGRSKVCQNWIDHRKPFGKCLVAVADASTFQDGVVYTISSDGQLLQFEIELQEWSDLGRPTWAPLGPAEGISIVNEQSGDRSMFLLSTEGTLVELLNRAPSDVDRSERGQSNIDSTSTVVTVNDVQSGNVQHNNLGAENNYESGHVAWEWFDHGCPDGDHIVGPPGGLINMRSIFMVSENGTVYERYWDESQWVWVSHGHSGVPTLPARPVALDNRHIFFLRGDGLLTERFWNGIEWVWSIHRVPQYETKPGIGENDDLSSEEGTMASADVVSFCSPEMGVRDSCAPPMFKSQ